MSKNILITAATSEFSHFFINHLIQIDCNLFLVSNNNKELLKIKKEVSKKNENKFEIFNFDLTKNDNAIKLYRTIKNKNIDIDVLITIPEIEGKASFSELQVQNYFETKDLLISSLITLNHFIAFDMLEKKSGKMMIFGSTLTYLPFSNYSIETVSNAYDLDKKANNLHLKMDNSTITLFNFSDENSKEKQNQELCRIFNKNYQSKILRANEIVKLSLETIIH
ncbi:SDR family NAD(P)-dependent oxidoreductase [Flavobacterium sp.]|jgi:short-subunit dehydrogenase|uniref:SDR family NAD(P)-dependent oxidoreductase n=1 Tax=Flavobacterium sp. TaxID=239 RepID=UPI0037C05202